MEDDKVVRLARSGSSLADDPLLAISRDGARRIPSQAIEAEVEAFVALHADILDEAGRRWIVCHG